MTALVMLSFRVRAAILRHMVTIGAPTASARPRVQLATLLAARDAGLTTSAGLRTRLAFAARHAGRGLRRTLVVAWRLMTTLLTLAVAGAIRHGLVLAGLAAFVWAAWSYSPIAGAVVFGLAALFLEARRQ
jgi:CO/xanthine dehydrogenase FAD-binding subunit